MDSTSKPTTLDRALRLFADVRPGESQKALLLALNVFLILMAYYVLKPVREALILGQGSAELKSYMAVGQVALLTIIVPLYGRMVAALPRLRLLTLVTWFFVGCLLVFYVLARLHMPLGIVYFLWIGIFSLMIVAQFWAFANDLYTKEEGERLFPVVGFGASIGAVFGSIAAAPLIRFVGIYEAMLVGAALLALQLQVTKSLEGRESAHGASGARPQPAASGGGNAFALVFRRRYLLYIALMLLVFNCINTTGEYILGNIVKDAATDYVAAGRSGGLSVEQVIGRFYSLYFGLVNIAGVLLQLFVVSRVVKYFSVPAAVCILPALSLAAYNVLAFVPGLWYVLGAKVAENSTDYSLNNTVRNMLFLPCTREEKYSAKQAIDSFFVRMGDVSSAGLVFLGSAVVQLGPAGFAKINIVLAAVGVSLAVVVGREYRRLTIASAGSVAHSGQGTV